MMRRRGKEWRGGNVVVSKERENPATAGRCQLVQCKFQRPNIQVQDPGPGPTPATLILAPTPPLTVPICLSVRPRFLALRLWLHKHSPDLSGAYLKGTIASLASAAKKSLRKMLQGLKTADNTQHSLKTPGPYPYPSLSLICCEYECTHNVC
jgi:hypothetical protein